jgi:hypothetical protein
MGKLVSTAGRRTFLRVNSPFAHRWASSGQPMNKKNTDHALRSRKQAEREGQATQYEQWRQNVTGDELPHVILSFIRCCRMDRIMCARGQGKKNPLGWERVKSKTRDVLKETVSY